MNPKPPSDHAAGDLLSWMAANADKIVDLARTVVDILKPTQWWQRPVPMEPAEDVWREPEYPDLYGGRQGERLRLLSDLATVQQAVPDVFDQWGLTVAEREEALFARAVLLNPADDTHRKVYADWLDEHDRPNQASYLRHIRRAKFVRRAAAYGPWALYPLHLVPAPRRIPSYRHAHVRPTPGLWKAPAPGVPTPAQIKVDLKKAMKAIMEAQEEADRIGDIYKYTNEPPPCPSPRVAYWRWRFAAGWRPPKHLKGAGYAERAEYYGVYVWEQLHVLDVWEQHHVLDPLLGGSHAGDGPGPAGGG